VWSHGRRHVQRLVGSGYGTLHRAIDRRRAGGGIHHRGVRRQPTLRARSTPGRRLISTASARRGFGTSHQLASKAYFTLRQSSLSEIYFPDLSTPTFRGLQFAVTDGETFVDRETVDDDPRHIEPTAPGVTARVQPIADSLSFRLVTETSRWRLTKTWISDPARATVLAQIRFESLTGKPLKLYVLADPAPGDDGNDDRGASGAHELSAYDDAAASVVAATPALHGTTSGYRGTASDPWKQLEATKRMTGYDATEPGNVVQAAQTGLNGRPGKQTMTLAIGLGGNVSAARAAATASLAGGFDAARTQYDAGWAAYLASLKAPPASVAGNATLRRIYQQSLLVLAASEDKVHRGAAIAAPNMAWIWGTLTLEPDRRFSGPYHLVWPRDLFHMATAEKAAGDGAGANRLLDYLWTVQKSDGSFWQNTRVDGTPKWTTDQLDQAALPIVLAW
jgi:glucoamylase